MTTLHVTPLGDQVDHDTSTADADCVCRPETRPVTQAGGAVGWLLVHHSLDGREHASPEGQGMPAPHGRSPQSAGRWGSGRGECGTDAMVITLRAISR